ncbi:MAG TPA: Gfo/Idh/MocA family oxidoreductase [Phycisphaerae bacterium]|nr:Gfo/Idh/MocA family oxidoreductase [Phycisphaerae bacterium]
MSEGKRIRVGLVGCGGIARGHARALLEQRQVDVTAICDPIKSHIAAYQREIFKPAGRQPKAYSDFGRMLTSVRLHAVVLCTPHTLHYEQVMSALDRGLHVLVEKPMVTDSGHAREVVHKAQSTGLVVAIAFQGSCSPEFAYIQNAIRRGVLGELQVVDTFVAQNWQRATAGTWRQKPALSGGGQLYDSGAHMLNALLAFVDAPPAEVFACIDHRGTDVDINAVVSVRFTNGCLGNLTCLGNAVTMLHDVTVYGTEGIVRTGVGGGRLEHYDAQGKLISYPHVPYEAQTPVSNFVHAIQGRDEVRAGPSRGLAMSELVDAIYESARRGERVAIAPDKAPTSRRPARGIRKKRIPRSRGTRRK